MRDFISEDDLQTFEGWLRYQAVDASTTAPEELAMWRRLFEEARQRSATSPKVGLMKLQPVPDEHRYAVAVREGADLWLTLWVRRSRKGEFFIMLPRGDRDWDPHTSYHLDGTLHMKSHDCRIVPPQKRQPLTVDIAHIEHMGVPANATPPLIEGKIIAALASGLIAKEVAQAVGVHPKTVYRLARKQENARLLSELRSELRARTMQHVARTQPKLLNRLEQEVEQGEARDLDALSRAALNLEKVSASVAGGMAERQQAPVQVAVVFADWVQDAFRRRAESSSGDQAPR